MGRSGTWDPGTVDDGGGRPTARTTAVATVLGLTALCLALTLVVVPAGATDSGVIGTGSGSGAGAPVTDAGVAVDADQSARGDVVLEDGRRYFVGQALYTDAFGPDEDVTLRRGDGSLIRFVIPDDEGRLVVETDDLAPGEYRVVGGDTALSFSLERHRYQVASVGSVVLNGGEDTTLTVLVESNRVAYTHVVSAEGLSALQLRSVLGTGRTVDVDDDDSEELLVEAEPQQEFAADFEGVAPGGYTLNFTARDTGERATVPIEVKLHPDGEARLSLDREEPVRLRQTAGQVFRGSSTLPEGTDLQVVVESVSGQQFRISRPATVRDGTFAATVDLSGVPVGQNLTVTVNQGPVVRDRVRGVVVAQPTVAGDVTVTTERVTVGAVTLPDGGFVTVTDTDGTPLGHSALLSPGDHRDVVVELDDPLTPGDRRLRLGLRRDDGDGTLDGEDPPYRVGGAVVSRTVDATVAGPTTTTTTTATTETTRQSATETTDTTTTPTTTTVETTTEADGAGGPGLGVGAALVGVGVLVIVLVVLLGAGRDRSGDEGGGGERENGDAGE